MNAEQDKKNFRFTQEQLNQRQSQFDYDQLAADIRRKKDDYSLIERDFAGVLDINQPSMTPFRWKPDDVGKEMVIIDELGLFGDQRIVELTLTYCTDETIVFQIDNIILMDIDLDEDEFEVSDFDEPEWGGMVRLRRGQIFNDDQLRDMSDFVYGDFGAPDHLDFSLYALIQYWAHHHALVQDIQEAAMRHAFAVDSAKPAANTNENTV